MSNNQRLRLNDATFQIWQLAVCLQLALSGEKYPDARATVELFKYLRISRSTCTEDDPDGDIARVDVQKAIDKLTEQLDDWDISGPGRDAVIDAVNLLGCKYPKDRENNDDN